MIVENLTAAIAEGGEIASLVRMLKSRERQLKMLDARLNSPPPRIAELRAALEERIEDWRSVLRTNIVQTRMVLAQLIDLPIETHLRSLLQNG